ncbi:hypothetical protein [Nocardiopsis synnemataformans]|uniref:hypothetical protein n=1 Tax=Nocardiopsis synnemataformans TaxID=61305 RepID=UPI003EBA6253
MFDPFALHRDLDLARQRRDISWRELCRQAHVYEATGTRLRRGHEPSATTLVRLLLWLNTTDLAPFIARPHTESTRP